MLAERDLELLTAYVDGELTRRQRKAVLRLLHECSEARSILQDLQETAHRLRELPHRKLGGAFAGLVLQSIADRGLQPVAPPQLAHRRRVPRWVGYAAAACVVLAVGIGIFLANQRSPSSNTIAVEPSKRPNDSAFQVTFKELVEQPKRELLAKQLQKETAVHLDVTVRDNAKAVEHLKDVLQGQGITLIVDARADSVLQKGGQGTVEYLVYAENIRTEELEAILRQLADQPKNKPSQQSTFEAVVVTSLSPEHRHHLSGLLGVDAAELEAPKRKGAGSRLFDKTMIEAPIKDQSKKTAIPPAPQLDRYAMVIANDAGTGGTSSAEVKRFLASRQQQRPETMQVLLVIRQA